MISLMYNSTKAYIGNVVKPLKQMTNIKKIENEVMVNICRSLDIYDLFFDSSYNEHRKFVHRITDNIIENERRVLFPNSNEIEWGFRQPLSFVEITHKPLQNIETYFYNMYQDISRKK